MEKVMAFSKNINTYNMDYDEISSPMDVINNRLCCTFFPIKDIDFVLNNIILKYNILYNKVFVLDIGDENEFVFTYNVDQGNVAKLPTNTILLHRKKQTNTLYTINALNELIKSLNGGKIDRKYPINWGDYQNTIILSQGGELRILKTKIHKIISL